MAGVTSFLEKIGNRLGVQMTSRQDPGLKAAAKSNPLGSILSGENLVITDGAAGQKLGERLVARINKMLNNAPANAAGLMMVLKATAEVNSAIAKNIKPNEEIQKKIKERLEELKKLEEQLEADDQNYEDVLMRFKEIFIDVQTEKLLDRRRTEEHPIQA